MLLAFFMDPTRSGVYHITKSRYEAKLGNVASLWQTCEWYIVYNLTVAV